MLRLRQTIISISFCLIGLGVTGLHAENAPAQAPSAVAPQNAVNLDKLKPNANPMNLSPAQQQALAALRKEQADGMQKITVLQRQLMELSYSDNYDKDKAGDLIGQIAKATEANLETHSKKANEFYLTLSPEQKKQYKAFEERRQKMLEQRMGAGRPAAAPPAPPKPAGQAAP